MGVTKQQVKAGNGTDKPKSGDNITMEYTGWLHDLSAVNQKGKQCVMIHCYIFCKAQKSPGLIHPSGVAISKHPLVSGVSSRVQWFHLTHQNSTLTVARLGRGRSEH